MSDRREKIKLNIGGMTCVHCQEKIERALSQTEGVFSATVSYGTGTAEIEYDREVVTEEELRKVVEALGYRPLSGDEGKGGESVVYPFLLFAVIAAAFALLQGFGVLNFLAPSGIGSDYGSAGYGMLFVIGLATSLHCVAMCGGINLSQCIPKADEGEAKGFRAFLPALFYNLGRVLSYTFIGFVLGLIGWIIGGGASVGIPYAVQGALKIVAGLLMVLMGVNMLGLVPALRKLNPHMPKFLARKIGEKRSSVRSPFVVGLLNGLMPCGPLQSMWIVALSTGNPFGGALSMFLFSLGTVPLMLGLGSLVAKLGQRFTRTVTCVGSLLVVVLGLAMLAQGGSLTGVSVLSPVVISCFVLSLLFAGIVCSLPVAKKWLKTSLCVLSCCLVALVSVFAYVADRQTYIDGSYDIATISEDGSLQRVTSTLDWNGYPKIAVTFGIPVEWTFVVPEGYLYQCNAQIVFTDFVVESDGEVVVSAYGEQAFALREGVNVFRFTPTKKGSFKYRCWMGMIYGNVAVVDASQLSRDEGANG